MPEELHFCKKHWDEAVPQRKDIVEVAEALARANAHRFRFTYEGRQVGRRLVPSFIVKGPEDYIEHGSIMRLLNSVPAWIGRATRSRKFRVPFETVRKRNLALPFFMSIANDAFLQSYFGLAFNARYVTDLPGEAEFFRTMNAHDELSRVTASLCAHLTHAIPILQDIPIEVILKVRQDEPEAFRAYRSTLTGIVRDYVRRGTSVTDREAADIYLDLLKPQLDALELQATNLRRAQIRSGLLKVVASSAVIGLGIYSGLLPAQLVDLVKAIGGFSVATDLAETIGAMQKNPTAIRNHNLYFLLRLKQRTTV